MGFINQMIDEKKKNIKGNEDGMETLMIKEVILVFSLTKEVPRQCHPSLRELTHECL